MIHQYKVELQERLKNQEKENNNFFKRECERESNKKFIENNMRRKMKNKKILINIKLSKSCYVIK